MKFLRETISKLNHEIGSVRPQQFDAPTHQIDRKSEADVQNVVRVAAEFGLRLPIQ
jgi:hypothetical protein